MTQVCVTVGATGAIFTSMRALLSPGDEVVLVDPAYDCYAPAAELAGGIVKRVPMKPRDITDELLASIRLSDSAGIARGLGLPRAGEHARLLRADDYFAIDVEALEAAITTRTKVLVLNSPHNPTGISLSEQDVERVAELVLRHPSLTVVLDSVYEHCRFGALNGGAKEANTESLPALPRLRSIREVRHRCLEVGSIGKTFSCTGFKIGWVTGPADLVARVAGVNQWSQFCVSTPLQVASAICLARAREPYDGFDTYYAWLSDMFRRKATALTEGLLAAGLSPFVPQAGFFIMADTSALGMSMD